MPHCRVSSTGLANEACSLQGMKASTGIRQVMQYTAMSSPATYWMPTEKMQVVRTCLAAKQDTARPWSFVQVSLQLAHLIAMRYVKA